MRTSVTLDHLYVAVCRLSRTFGKRFAKALHVRSVKSRRFPTFNIPVDAPLISASHIQQILEEEGLF